MKMLGKKADGGKILTDNEIRVFRTIIIFAAIITPAFSYLWTHYYSRMNIIKSAAIIISSYYIGLIIASHTNDFIKHRQHYFLYFSFYIITLFAVYLGYVNRFSEGYSLLLMLIVFYIIQTFNKVTHLLYYLISTLLLLLGVLIFCEFASHNPLHIVIGASFIVFSVIAVFNLKLRVSYQRGLNEAEDKYKKLVEGAPVGVYVHQNKKMVYVNNYIEELLGYSLEELSKMESLQVVYLEDREILIESTQKILTSSEKVVNEFRAVKKDGSVIHIQVQGAITTYGGAPAFTGTIMDITEKKLSEERIHQMAYYDSLTNLPNRYILKDYLKAAIDECRENELLVCVMFVDLDRFKEVNDTLGHNFGDLVLQEASERLKACIRRVDFLARYGGDEFIIILKKLSKEEVNIIAERIISDFSSPFNIENKQLQISPSIGISICPFDSEDPETLIKYADEAMYVAKGQGRNSFRFYIK